MPCWLSEAVPSTPPRQRPTLFAFDGATAWGRYGISALVAIDDDEVDVLFETRRTRRHPSMTDEPALSVDLVVDLNREDESGLPWTLLEMLPPLSAALEGFA